MKSGGSLARHFPSPYPYFYQTRRRNCQSCCYIASHLLLRLGYWTYYVHTCNRVNPIDEYIYIYNIWCAVNNDGFRQYNNIFTESRLKIIDESPHEWRVVHGKPYIILFLTRSCLRLTQRNRWKLQSVDRRVIHAHLMRLMIVVCYIKEACETESPKNPYFSSCLNDWIINTKEKQPACRLKLYYRKTTLNFKAPLNRACLTIWNDGWHSENAMSSSGSLQKIPCSIVICWSYKRRRRSPLAFW